MARQRLNSMDNLKLILILLIIYWHIMCSEVNLPFFYKEDIFYNSLSKFLKPMAYIFVNYFFIISGIFFRLSLDTTIGIKSFLNKKLQNLWPILFFSIFSISIISLLGFNFPKLQIEANFLNLLFIHKEIGLSHVLANNGPSWYICALFWSNIILYGMCDKNCKKYIFYIVFLSTMLWVNNINIFPGEFIRAVALMGIGYFTGQFWIIYRNHINFNSKFTNVYFFSILEIVFLFLITKACVSEVYLRLFPELLFCFFCLLIFSNHGIVSRVLTIINLNFLSKHSLSIYLMQEFSFRILRGWWTKKLVIDYKGSTVIASVLFCILVGIFSGIFVNYIRQCMVNRKNNDTIS